MDTTSFALILSFSLLLRCLSSQQPNTDAYFVSAFFQTMGASPASMTDSGSSTDVCSWQGVSCDDQSDRVVSLVAHGLGLSGPIPDITIGKLSELHTLDLSGNNITAFSSDFWELGDSIRFLNLSSNSIAGTVSNNIGNLNSLESLDFSSNSFSGEIPASIGSLSSLRILDVSNNLLTGRIPDALTGCASLVSVDISRNNLSGSLPNDLGTAFKSMKRLDVSENALTGRVPDLSGLSTLKYINLSSNMLQGSVVGVFQNNLQTIDLSKNQFQGHISQVNISSTFNWSSLVYLDMSMNELSGELYTDLREARSLRHLNLAFNKFSPGGFPKLGKLNGLEYLNLSKTGLIGRIPPDFSHLYSLKELDLSRNHITGSVPELQSKNLEVLDLSMNNLTGVIPQSLQDKLLTMKKFNFSYNNLTFCGNLFSAEIMNSSFIGSQVDCPIAVNPQIVRTKPTKRKGFKLALAIAFATFFLIAGLICLAFGLRKRNRSWLLKQMSSKEEQNLSGPYSFQTDSTTWVADVKQANSVPVVIFEKPLLNCTFADLLAATSNFDRGTLLAEGRFGPVYKVFLPGGILVAVKVLVHGSTVSDQEAAKELERLGRIKHPNLVPLAGYCLAGEQRIVIYDYMENGNLQSLLHDSTTVQTTEDLNTGIWEEQETSVQVSASELVSTWGFRHKIALGIARALSFLHHGCFPQIVHRDVKASSIYLDFAMEPRLADFGLSKLVGTSLDDEISHGSLGYIPPEFSELENASATAKSDVYGFGVVLFELITGKKPVGDEYDGDQEASLVHWARTYVRRNEGLKIVDPKIRETAPEKQIEEALRIAYLCTADLPSKRPNMQQIVGLLKDIEPLDNL